MFRSLLVLFVLVLAVGCNPDKYKCPECGECPECAVCPVCETCAVCPVCTPDCNQKVCGGDGCGGICGACAVNTRCADGKCKNSPTCSEMAKSIIDCQHKMGDDGDIFQQMSQCADNLDGAASAKASFYAGSFVTCMSLESIPEGQRPQLLVNVCNNFVRQCD